MLHRQSVIIGGTVFIDKNDNGIKDSDEIAIGDFGKTVILDLLDQDGNLVETKPTDADGFYFFITQSRNYFVQMNPPNSLPISSSCLLYTSPSPRDKRQSRMPSSA